jgi:hypothetical protein
MNMSNNLDSVENAILSLLAQRDNVSIEQLLKDLSNYPESEVRRAVWALLSAHEIEVSSDYSLRRSAVCA